MGPLIQAMEEARVRYLLIGGQAMRLHGMPRFSMDWDFYLPNADVENFGRLNTALAPFLEEPVTPLGPRGEGFVQTFQTSYGLVQFHLLVPGVAGFDEMEAEAAELVDEHGNVIKCLPAGRLLQTKLAANRPQDQTDIAFLQELVNQREG